MMVRCIKISSCSNPMNTGRPGFMKLIDFRTNEGHVFHNTQWMEYGGYVVIGEGYYNLSPLGVVYVQDIIDKGNRAMVDLFNIRLSAEHIVLM